MQALSISHRLFRGLGSQIYGQAVQMLVRFAEVPLLLHFWGAQLYGEWLMLAAIPAYLAIGDGGFAGAASRDMGMRSGAGRRDDALAVFQSTAIFLILISLGLIVIALAVVEIIPLAHLFSFQAISAAQFKMVFFLLVLHVLVGFQGGLINGGFWCSGSYPLGMVFESTTLLLEFAALAFAVILGGGPTQAAAAYLTGRILGTFIARLGLKRATPWLFYGLGHVSFNEIRRLTAPAFASLAFPLGNALNIQGIRIVVGIVLGPAAVAIFVPLRTLSNLVIQPRSIINRLVEPELGLAFGREDPRTIGRLFLQGSQFAFWSCGLVAVILLLVGPWFLPMWTRGQVQMQWPLFLALLFAAMLNSIWYTALVVPYATNRHGRIALAYSIVYGGGVLAAAYFCLASIGLSGAGVGLVASEIAMAAYVVPAALRMSQKSGIEWFKALMRPPSIAPLFHLVLSLFHGRRET